MDKTLLLELLEQVQEQAGDWRVALEQAIDMVSESTDEEDYDFPFEELSDRFTTLPNPDDPTEADHWEHHQVKDLPVNNVWTIVGGDSGRDWWALTGFHIVNKLFYVVTKEPWTDEDSSKEFRY